MANKTTNNIKLGLFVVAGLLFLIVMLYMIGKDQNLFSRNIELKARFSNVQGLVKGNNVKYAGIQVGTVKNVKLINDTTVEIIMLIDEKLRSNIRKNAIASIGTEGVIGNKIVNILPGSGHAAPIDDGDLLAAKKVISTDDMLETLSASNKNIAIISEELKSTIQRINQSKAMWELLNDDDLPINLKKAAININQATAKANNSVNDFHDLLADVKMGKGSLGKILTDTSFAIQMADALEKLKQVGDNANKLSGEIDEMVKGINTDVNEGKGAVNALLKDSAIVIKLNKSLDNIEKGTTTFNQNMEALKHNFLFSGYFKKLEKQKEKEAKKKTDKSY
jgi:phospholipid/cholesterol/gamma-HCH transport system substrate-binding protein